jgi:hypothetical protein
VSASVVKWSEVVKKRVSNIIKIYTDNLKFAAYFLFLLTYGFMLFSDTFCVVYMVVSIYLYKYNVCILIGTYLMSLVFFFIVLFCLLPVCKCVLYTCNLVSSQLQLTNITYHINGIIDIRNRFKSFGPSMALWSKESLTESSTSDIR